MTDKISLKTAEMEAIYDLRQKMIELIQKEKILAGDIVMTEVNYDEFMTMRGEEKRPTIHDTG